MNDERKIWRSMPKEKLPGFLRDLADAIEQGGDGDFDAVDQFSTLKLRIKDEFGQTRVELTLKKPPSGWSARTGGPRGDHGMPKYKDLKKRMKRSFRAIRQALREGRTPPAEATASFLADAGLMTGYSGKGEEFYEEFKEACRAFSEACASGDLNRMGEAAEELRRQKRRCHDRHK
jgi:XXXCH domain-containing protein